ncbi:hypothetical protein CP533_2757 [Ophiocordyceps camponoti-saundersi (nom. inval.)]|nr:hypothetical protein CP533_2757 [Ophiocordyceps camponoti-saundersi (nom. inval.)]
MTEAQEEFKALVARRDEPPRTDSHHNHHQTSGEEESEEDEESVYRAAKIEQAMRMPAAVTVSELQLPPASFDSGCATGVKGVIADARAFQSARRSKWIDRARVARRSIFGAAAVGANTKSESDETDDEQRPPASAAGSDVSSDEEAFLQQWRESRRRELEVEAGRAVRSRRTSPSMRIYGRLDKVDALGYLDAIERVTRDTKVVVFVYDNECDVSATIESALLPLVKENPTVHFVKVHYDDIEFDPAAVPSLLAYRNQGDLFANLTGLIEMMPDDGTKSLRQLLQNHQVL